MPPRSRVPAGDARDVVLGAVTEREWQAQIERWAERGGWLYWHLPPCEHNRKGKAGLPDIVAIHPERHAVLFLELKRAGKQPTAIQQAWLTAAGAAQVVYAGWADPLMATELEFLLTGALTQPTPGGAA